MSVRPQLSREIRGAGKGSPEICLLGPLELRRGGQPVRLGGAHARTLLALLSLYRGTVVSVDRIVDGLWGESPPPTARHMVEVYVSKLRKVLGADVVVTRRPGYLLAVDPESVDVARFERLLAEGRDALGEADWTVAAARLENGLSLWRGPALADFAYEPFAQTEIARLEELRLLAEEEWLEADLELGKGAELVAKLEELIAAAPFRERFRAQLVLALYRAGRQADALAAYRSARETFVEELGIEPGPTLRELERAILAQEESLNSPRALDRRRPEVRETRRIVTVLFVELAVPEAKSDPEALRHVVTRQLERAEDVLQRHGAFVERVPDGSVMAVFGSPVAHEDDAVRSLHAVSELRELGVASRAAVDTGEVLAGPELVVRGPVVRAAAQLLASASSDEVLAGELTWRLAAHSAQFEAADLDAANAWRLVGVERGAALRPLLLAAPVVGRRKELAELRKALARAVHERRPHLVTIVGEAGIGKSRLAREFASAAKAEARFLTGRCLAYGEGITYWPLREMIRELAPDESVQALNALVPGLADGERIARRLAATVGLVEDVYPVEEVRWAARRFFEQLASERPLVLVFEDVHWAEPSFLDLLRHILDVGDDAPILLVCLTRPEMLEGPDGAQTILVLEALSASEAEELVSRLDPAETLPRDHRAQLLAAAEGNPLFLEQLVAFATERRSQAHHLDVPPTLQALLAARLDLLGPGESAVVECAAVVGREFWVAAVAELLPPEARTTLLRHLEGLERKELLEPEGSALPFERAFRFRHVLIQEAAYRSLPKERRAELHERLSGWLERTNAAGGGDQDEIAGYHLEQAYECRAEVSLADESMRALALGAGEKLSAAAERALARNDLPAAANLLTRATGLYEAGGRPRPELLVDLGAALLQLGEGPRALAVLEAVLQAARATREPALEWRAKLERDYTVFHLESGVLSTEEGLRNAECAVRALERLGDERALSRAWRSVTQCRLWLGRMASSLDASERALYYARRAGDRQGEIWTLRIHIMALWTGPTPAVEAARRCEEILAAAENEEVVACALENLGGLRAMQGRSDEARRLVDSSAAIYEALGLTLRRAFCVGIHRTEVHTLSGDLAAAEQDLRSAIELFESIGDKSTRSLAIAWLAGTVYDVGRYSEAEQHVETGEQLSVVDDYAANSKLRAVQGKILARRGEFERAKAAAQEAVRIADATDDLDSRGQLWMDEAEVLKLAGEPEGAASCLRRAIDLLEQKGNIVLAGRARARLAELREAASSR